MCRAAARERDASARREQPAIFQSQATMKTQLAILTLAAALQCFAADITGAWKAEFNTQRGLQKYTFTLKQDGAKVTGKASVEREGEKREAELKDGKVE